MALKYLATGRIQGTTAERTALSGTTPTAIPQTSWKQLAKTTLVVQVQLLIVEHLQPKIIL